MVLLCGQDWHPTDASMLLAASRDDSVSVWDLSVERDDKVTLGSSLSLSLSHTTTHHPPFPPSRSLTNAHAHTHTQAHASSVHPALCTRPGVWLDAQQHD